MRESPTLVRLKFIIAPLAVVAFLAFSGLEIKSYLSQLPVLSVKLSNSQTYPVPAMVFAFPWSAANDAVISPTLINITSTPPTLLNDIYTITKKSLDFRAFPGTIPPVTMYLMFPKRSSLPYPWRMSVGFNRRDATNGFAATGVNSIYTEVWVFGLLRLNPGTRFTQGSNPNEFGINPDLASILPSVSPGNLTSLFTQSSLVRDENNFFQDGGVQTTFYTLSHADFVYLNKSVETFFKVAPLGSSTNIGQTASDPNPRMQMEFLMTSDQTMIYSEYLPKSPTAVIGSVMTAFQVILITGLKHLMCRFLHCVR